MDTLKPLISPVGFGAFKIGRNQGIKYPQDYDLPDEAGAERLLNGVLDLGVTYIDTASAYGLSEERIGKFLSHRRGEFVLSTKVGERFENGKSTHDFSTGAVRFSIEQSLRRLRTDVLDIVFIHAPREDLAVLRETDAVSALASARDAGLVRAIGFSGYTAEAFGEALSWSNALMIEYHPGDRRLEPLIAEATAQNMLVMVKKGLGSGQIPAREAIEFTLDNAGVTSLVIGSLSLEHMAENVALARAARPLASEV